MKKHAAMHLIPPTPGNPDGGFSLVELSIVLVILGLLVGGVLAGQSLIRASELRAIGTENARWVTATNTFKDKYFGIPGDIPNATSFWSGTSNGDRDGLIAHGSEGFRFWQQLALANLIEGSYTGVAGPGGGADMDLGVNTPRSKIANTGWGATAYYNICCQGFFQLPGSSSTNPYGIGNYFSVGIKRAVGEYIPYESMMTPQEAWNIDTKLDDGRPSYGKVVSRMWCTTAVDGTATIDDLNTVYTLSNPNITCNLFFIGQF